MPRSAADRIGWLTALAVPAGVAAWIAAGSFLPLVVDPSRAEYVFISASYTRLVLSLAAAFAVVGAAGLNQRRFAPAILTASLDPLALFALIPALAPVAGPLVFVAIDLRRWRVAAAVLLLAAALLEGRAGGRAGAWWTRLARAWSALPPRTRRIAIRSSIFVFGAVFAVWTSTLLRFTPLLHGDEPKYVRYCENLYQGNGFDITDIKPVAELPADAPSHMLVNVRYAFATIGLEFRRFRRDLKRRDGDPEFVFNRGKFVEGWFVYSKTGRIFQVHTPGVSLLMAPFYYLDRRFLGGGETTYRGQFAGRLFATSTYFLGMFALWGVVIYDLLRRGLGREWIAGLLALLAVATIPITAFAFQMYPETTAGVFITAVCAYLGFGRRASPLTAAFNGALAGYLPWLHVRFLGDAGLLLVWAMVVFRRERRAAIAFAGAWAIVMAALSLHAYHVTGSAMPTALYDTEGVPQVLSAAKVANGLTGFVVDRGYGLLPYSPYFALALLGVWPFARREPLTAAFCFALFLAAAIPSAAHSWTAAGGSPLRHIVALMPLWLLPLGEAMQRFAGNRRFWLAFGVLALLSLQSAVAYNNLHFKAYGPMVDESVSGWKVNLMFPDLYTDQALWPRTIPQYLPAALDTRTAVWRAFEQHGCTLCASSVRGRLTANDFAALKPNVVR